MRGTRLLRDGEREQSSLSLLVTAPRSLLHIRPRRDAASEREVGVWEGGGGLGPADLPGQLRGLLEEFSLSFFAPYHPA